MASNSSKSVDQSAAAAERRTSLDHDDELPTYADSTPGPLALEAQSTTSSASHPIGPTVSAPFNFPTTSTEELAPPEYISSRPIAIPQQLPQATAPFLYAYAPVLLNYGIPPESWYSFIDTMCAFLTAKVGKRAVSHAGDIAASIGRVPKNLGKDVGNHVKSTFSRLGNTAKTNPVGLVGGVIGATIGLTVGTAAKVVGSTMSLPGTAIAASASVKTPKERAEAYTTAANKDWFHKRSLHAELMNTAQLATLLQTSVQQILDTVHARSSTAEDQMNALRDLIEGVELRGKKPQASSPAPATSPAGFPADVKERPQLPASVGSEAASSSTAKADDGSVPLHISAETLWLVLRRDAPPSIPKKPGT